jgi:glycosyltransferase involved in cell wall biosynthesis
MTARNRPTVLHVINSLEGGGTERTLLALLGALDPSTARHTLATLRSAGALATRLPDHVPCWAIESRGKRRTSGVTLGRIARAWNASLIHARNIGCWTDAMVAGMLNPGVHVLLGFHGLDQAAPLSPHQRRIAKWSSRLGARFTVVAESGRRRLAKQAGIDSARITLLLNGVDLERFKPIDDQRRAAARDALGLPNGAFTVGTAGSLTRVKRPDLLVRTVARLVGRLPDLHLVLFGDGPLMGEVRGQIQSAGLAHRVHLPGHQDDIQDRLAALDVYVCASDSEEFSKALLEAMACALPVVSTDVGDHPRILREGRFGVLVPCNDVPSLAAAVESLAEPTARRTLAAAARERALDFDFAATVTAYERYYASLLPLQLHADRVRSSARVEARRSTIRPMQPAW